MSTMVVEAEELMHTVDVEEVHKLGDTAEGCIHPLVSIVPHRPISVWISLHRSLIMPWNVSIVPH